MYTAVTRGSVTLMKICLIAVMTILAFVAVDITIRIGWDRFISGIGSLVDGQQHAEQVSPDSAQPRTMPPQQNPLPRAPVPALTPEGKPRPESSASVETPEPVKAPSDFVVMPGKLVGNFSLGMTREEIRKIAPKPQETFSDRLVYKS